MAWRFILGAATLVCSGAFSPEVMADDVFERPVRLQADGKVIDTGKAWGHGSPCIEDIDGDGLKDLILGDFSGKFHIYRNVGKQDASVYHDVGKVQADGKDASVKIYCCIGSQPRFVDLDGDGIRDFISNSYDPGHCYFFRGLGDHKFAAGKELIDKVDVPVRSSPKQKQAYQSFGSFFAPVDWDGDGDFDLLIGCFDGSLRVRINEGDAKHAVWAAENRDVLADGEPLKVERHCCPVGVDWDSDGLWDIVAGADDGSVTWFRNVGDKKTSRFDKGVVLKQKCDNIGYNLLRWTDDDIAPAIRSQVEVADMNGDGKLDLLVGDFCTAYEPRKDLSASEKKEFLELIDKEEARGKSFRDKMKSLQDEFAKRYPGDAVYSNEATAEWAKRYKALRESPEAKELEKRGKEWTKQMRSFLARTHRDGDHNWDLAIPHGYVWLYIRK